MSQPTAPHYSDISDAEDDELDPVVTDVVHSLVQRVAEEIDPEVTGVVESIVQRVASPSRARSPPANARRSPGRRSSSPRRSPGRRSSSPRTSTGRGSSSRRRSSSPSSGRRTSGSSSPRTLSSGRRTSRSSSPRTSSSGRRTSGSSSPRTSRSRSRSPSRNVLRDNPLLKRIAPDKLQYDYSPHKLTFVMKNGTFSQKRIPNKACRYLLSHCSKRHPTKRDLVPRDTVIKISKRKRRRSLS